MKIDRDWVVFFDAGHTLLHPKRSVGSVYAEVAEHYGVKADAGQLGAGFRAAWKRMKVPAAHDARRNEKLWWKQVVEQTWHEIASFENLPFDDYFETVYDAFARPGLWSVYPDVWELLDWLKQQEIPCGILSNWDERLWPLLTGHGLTDYFDPVIISAEHGVSKPDTEIFRIAEQSTPVECFKYLLVGDDNECDCGGAKSAGWEFYHVQRPDQDLDALRAKFSEHNKD